MTPFQGVFPVMCPGEVVGVDPHRDEHALGIVEVRTGVVVFETAVAADSPGYADALAVAVVAGLQVAKVCRGETTPRRLLAGRRRPTQTPIEVGSWN